MAADKKHELGGLIVALGGPPPKKGSAAGGDHESMEMDDSDSDSDEEGKRMAGAALRSALKGNDDMAIYDAFATLMDYCRMGQAKEPKENEIEIAAE